LCGQPVPRLPSSRPWPLFRWLIKIGVPVKPFNGGWSAIHWWIGDAHGCSPNDMTIAVGLGRRGQKYDA
jgi:hypothetical protein